MYVYFVKACDKSKQIKIGRTSDIGKRLSSLQTGSPVKLKIIGIIECRSDAHSKEIETELHKMFAPYRTHGEWFRSTQNMLNFIRAANEKNPSMIMRSLQKNKKQITKQFVGRGNKLKMNGL